MAVIVRAFATDKAARNAEKQLKAEVVRAEEVAVLAPKPEGDPAAEVSAAVDQGRLPASYAKIAVDNLKEGRSLIIVNPPFGSGKRTDEILQAYGPTVLVDPEPVSTPTGGFFSDVLGMPLLTDSHRYFLFSGELKNPKSQTKLIDDPAPLSNRVGFKLLSEKKDEEWTRSFGQPLLSSKAYSLGEPKLDSNKYSLGEPELKSKRYTTGEPQLSSDPAPLSNKLGWPVLIR